MTTAFDKCWFKILFKKTEAKPGSVGRTTSSQNLESSTKQGRARCSPLPCSPCMYKSCCTNPRTWAPAATPGRPSSGRGLGWWLSSDRPQAGGPGSPCWTSASPSLLKSAFRSVLTKIQPAAKAKQCLWLVAKQTWRSYCSVIRLCLM